MIRDYTPRPRRYLKTVTDKRIGLGEESVVTEDEVLADMAAATDVVGVHAGESGGVYFIHTPRYNTVYTPRHN